MYFFSVCGFEPLEPTSESLGFTEFLLLSSDAVDSALLVPVLLFLFVWGFFVFSFLESGNSKVSFVGGSVSLVVFASVCLSVSSIWSVVEGCVGEVGILCAWVCELVLFGFSVFGH